MKIEEESRPSGQMAQGNGWQAPVYKKSLQVQPDPGALAASRCVSIPPGAREIGHYKVLRTQVMQKTREKGWNTLMVTSAHDGEGKTLTAINLAMTLAMEINQTVLLVDCDMRKQDIHKRFGYHSEKGLADYLLHGSSLTEIISWPKVDKMTIISGGPTIQESAELLGSPQMRNLVVEMKQRYADRYVIFDLPSLLDGADGITFAPLVDGILLVAEPGRNTSKEMNQALDLLPREKVLGFVLNRQG